MKAEVIYRPLLIIAVVGQLIWAFAPWEQLYSNNHIAVSLVASANSLVPWSVLGVASYFVFVSYLAACAGMYFYRSWGRLLFLITFVFSVIFLISSGLSVQSGYEAGFGFVLTLVDGLIVGLSFFSGINSKFLNR